MFEKGKYVICQYFNGHGVENMSDSPWPRRSQLTIRKVSDSCSICRSHKD